MTATALAALNQELMHHTIVKHLALERLQGEIETELKLTVCRSREHEASALELRATHVTSFAFGPDRDGISQLMQVTVTDISDEQHDRTNFEVRDVEDDRIRFRCHRLVVLRVPSGDEIYSG